MNQLLVIIGAIIIAIGVKMIYDARPIVKAYFSFGEENEAVLRNENSRICISHNRWIFDFFAFLKAILPEK